MPGGRRGPHRRRRRPGAVRRRRGGLRPLRRRRGPAGRELAPPRPRPGQTPKCLEGSPGAAFHRVAPGPGERVFTKYACFDAFLSAGFEDHLRARATAHLVLAGVYADVCVDSTARTAFQKGFHVTVVPDCTTSLHLPTPDILGFMERVYGARLLARTDPGVWSHPALATERQQCPG
ncbi:cysteine hydrolase [Streptomyces sp. AD16]|nr:cysteine hydrolase [Streptomyces sp. AD16]